MKEQDKMLSAIITKLEFHHSSLIYDFYREIIFSPDLIVGIHLEGVWTTQVPVLSVLGTKLNIVGIRKGPDGEYRQDGGLPKEPVNKYLLKRRILKLYKKANYRRTNCKKLEEQEGRMSSIRALVKAAGLGDGMEKIK